LRPQLLDRFGLSVDVRSPDDVPTRVQVVRRRDAYERDHETFLAEWAEEEAKLRRRLTSARKKLAEVDMPDELYEKASALCIALGTDGLRGELTLIRATRAAAALKGKKAATVEHLKSIAPLALRHRLRRDPLDEAGSGTRVDRAVEEVLG
jgi:magnesium chelatase subunit I